MKRDLKPYYKEITSLYNEGLGTMYISNKLNIHRGDIQRILKSNKVLLRKTSPYKIYNVKFFDTFSEQSCYWAGFIAADGYIRKNRNSLHIKLQLQDYHHLLKFKKCIQYDGNVNISEDKYCYIDICGEWFVKDLLNKFDIHNRKSLSLKFCENIPEHLLSHYIRGFFDGDGCITRQSCTIINFTSGSKKFLEKLSSIFKDKLFIKLKSKNETPPIQNMVQISYSGKNAKKILDWLYTNSNIDIRLDRKYSRYLEYFNLG